MSSTKVAPARTLHVHMLMYAIPVPTHSPYTFQKARLPAMRWATFLLVGHGAIAAVSCAYGMYLIPVLISLGPFYNGWLFFLCNSTQHVGMHHAGGGGGNATKVVEDFRLTTRSFTGLNPIVSIW